MEKTNFSKPFLTPSQLIAKWGKVLAHDNSPEVAKERLENAVMVESQEHWIKTPDKLDDKKE
jgi:hypothetical protein